MYIYIYMSFKRWSLLPPASYQQRVSLSPDLEFRASPTVMKMHSSKWGTKAPFHQPPTVKRKQLQYLCV